MRRPYPGAELIPGATRTSTMAVTIDAPPSRVWPWLVQMGVDRGGWYSWDRLDDFGRRSTERVHPGYWSLRPRWLQPVLSFVFMEPSHWIMQTRQFANLKRRAESDLVDAQEPLLVLGVNPGDDLDVLLET